MPGTRPLRSIQVGLVDDHQVLTDALSAMLGAAPNLRVLFTAPSCAGLRAALARHCPDVLLLDVNLPDGNGLDLVPEVHAACPAAAVVVLTSLSDEGVLLRALELGVAGFVPKSQPLPALLKTIQQAAAGEIVVPTSLLQALLSRTPNRRSKVTPQSAPLLTPREREILVLLAQGKSSAEIAEALVIALPTVRTHIGNLLTKLGVHSRLQAVAYALSHGLIRR